MREHLVDEFRRQAEAVLARYPDLPHEWKVEHDAIRLSFPATRATGFAVQLVAGEGYIKLIALGAHESFDLRGGPSKQIAAAALGLVRDLLSQDMRIRELRANGRPYKWILEARDGAEWHSTGTTGLLFFNYFGAREERVYQNEQLPGRLAAEQPG